MEYSLTLSALVCGLRKKEVLILILMEYSLTEFMRDHSVSVSEVLILILMEYSLTASIKRKSKSSSGLNPYSNGILSDKQSVRELFTFFLFNPCYRGILFPSES